MNVFGQTVWVGLNLGDGILPVGLVDADGPAGADAVAVKEDHDLPDDLLFCPGFLDAFPAFRTDAVQFLQPGGLRLDDVEDFLAKLAHQLLGVHRADPFDHAAAQVFLNALPAGWRTAAEQDRPKLAAEFSVLNPITFSGHPFAGADRWQRADDRDEVPVPLGFDLEHGIAGVFIEKGDALNQA